MQLIWYIHVSVFARPVVCLSLLLILTWKISVSKPAAKFKICTFPLWNLFNIVFRIKHHSLWLWSLHGGLIQRKRLPLLCFNSHPIPCRENRQSERDRSDIRTGPHLANPNQSSTRFSIWPNLSCNQYSINRYQISTKRLDHDQFSQQWRNWDGHGHGSPDR